MNFIVKNAYIHDGSGSKPYNGAVVVNEGVINFCGTELPAGVNFDIEIDAEGRILAPGFIDAHGHSDISILAAPEAIGKVSQGITTEISGNCGLAPFPVNDLNREHLQELYRRYDVSIDWSDLRGYLHEVRRRKPAINVIPLAGHNTLRAAVCGYNEHKLSISELHQAQKLLDQCFRQGAAGFSSGLLYVPGVFSDAREITALLDVVAAHHKPYTTHLRSEGKAVLESLEETFSAALVAGLERVHISHLKVSGSENWHKMSEVFYKLAHARSMGLKVTADRYPYTESMTQLSVILPEPYNKLDDVSLEKLMLNEAEFPKIKAALKTLSRERWQTSRLVSTAASGYSRYQGMTFAAISEQTLLHPSDICADILRADAAGSMGAFQGMDPENMHKILMKPYVACGTDETARPQGYELGRSHPRGFGSFPEYIKLLLQAGLPMQQVIRRVTALPAEIFGLQQRGLVKSGFIADLVLFSPDLLESRATFAAPHNLSRGIDIVWKSGKITWQQGDL
ncbi:amidohydrolase family protein [Lentisphaerota bacterium ZTH]|nr:amidohydrolase family protein [Lentisphaerota bacterium]WET06369.1 amidohydrolase family protein [Lentisphaerota bacterium ZTH]